LRAAFRRQLGKRLAAARGAQQFRGFFGAVGKHRNHPLKYRSNKS
jgi:hypothetical protein